MQEWGAYCCLLVTQDTLPGVTFLSYDLNLPLHKLPLNQGPLAGPLSVTICRRGHYAHPITMCPAYFPAARRGHETSLGQWAVGE